LIFEQDLFTEDDAATYDGAFGFGREPGLDGFLSLSYSSKKTSPLAWMAVSGLVYTGLIPGRDADATALIATYGRFSGDLRDYQRASSMPLQHYELVLELNHRINLTRGFYIQPDLQAVIRPNGYSDTPNALVLGLNLGISF
jgi:porin